MIVNPTKSKATGIHSGAVTHHQDHVMVSVSFNTKKIKNRTVPKPSPFDEFELFVISLFFYVLKG